MPKKRYNAEEIIHKLRSGEKERHGDESGESKGEEETRERDNLKA